MIMTITVKLHSASRE